MNDLLALLPCPFCGSPVDCVSYEGQPARPDRWYMLCGKCGAEGPRSTTQQLKELWNRRASIAEYLRQPVASYRFDDYQTWRHLSYAEQIPIWEAELERMKNKRDYYRSLRGEFSLWREAVQNYDTWIADHEYAIDYLRKHHDYVPGGPNKPTTPWCPPSLAHPTAQPPGEPTLPMNWQFLRVVTLRALSSASLGLPTSAADREELMALIERMAREYAHTEPRVEGWTQSLGESK